MQHDLRHLPNRSHLPAARRRRPSRSLFRIVPEEHSRYASEDHFPANPLEDLKYKHDLLSAFCCTAQWEHTPGTGATKSSPSSTGTSLGTFTEEGMENVNKLLFFYFLWSRSPNPTDYVLLRLPCAILRNVLLFTLFWNCVQFPWERFCLWAPKRHGWKAETAEMPDTTAVLLD